jgi:hypothetical protein
MHNMGDNGYFCSTCKDNSTSEFVPWAKDIISGLNIPIGKNIPLSAKVLDNLFVFLKRYIEKYGHNTLNSNDWEKIFYLANKANLAKGSIDYLHYLQKNKVHQHTSNLLEEIQNNVDARNYMKEQYPNLSNYQDIPFDIDVVSNYNNEQSGFTITISPSDDFLNYAKNKYPDMKQIWDTMKMTPHHKGVLAYARCAYDDRGIIVINNLQRDADFDNYISRMEKENNSSKSNKDAAKWFDSMTKNWDVFLLHLIKSMAIKEDISAFMTTFDQQKGKWSNLPVHKSKKSYKEVPESMGFSLDKHDKADDLLESRTPRRLPMYQIAIDRGMNWYKIAQTQVEETQYIGSAPISRDRHLNYTDIGHKMVESDILWIWRNNELLTYRGSWIDTHENVWQNYNRNDIIDIQGRYEISTGYISIYCNSRSGQLPERLLYELERVFPDSTKAFIFSKSLDSIKTSSIISFETGSFKKKSGELLMNWYKLSNKDAFLQNERQLADYVKQFGFVFSHHGGRHHDD